MDSITILELFCLVSAIITYGLGIFVFAKNSSSRVNHLFLLVNIGASYWAVGEFLIWRLNTYENVWFWLKVSSFWTVVIVSCIHFVLTFADHPLSKPEKIGMLALILYVPACILAFINIFTDAIFKVNYSPDIGYYYIPAYGNPIYVMTTAYFLLVLFWAAYVGFHTRKSAGSDTFRRQSSSISIGLLILIGFGSQSVVILPLFGIYAPNLVFIGIVLFSIAISYAILKYGLFVLSPETVATNIIQTMPDGLILADMDGRIITTNASATTLLSGTGGVNGKSISHLFLSESMYSDIRQTIKDRGYLSDFEVIPDQKDPKTVSISGSLVSDPYGEPAGIILIVHDITERKASEKILRLANDKISLLNRLTRHDISNLITALSGYLEILKDETDERCRKEMLDASTDLIERITRHLHFSREYQTIGLHEPRWQSVEKMIHRAIADINFTTIELIVNLTPVEIFADPLSVKVIYNILENAMRHATGVSKISIYSEERANGSYLLVIEDNGPGVKPLEKERIFEQAYGKNTGLGLTLSREILAVTDITLCENGKHGSGARFEICVPSGCWREIV